MIEQAERAGFRLAGRSEINANPDPNFDHSKYDAIGESDRMALKFQKPG